MLPSALSLPHEVSADGRVVSGSGYQGSPGQLLQAGLLALFGAENPLGENAAIADWTLVGASEDGRRLAGWVKRSDRPLWQGFLWDRESGFVDTPPPPVFDVAAGTPSQAEVERAVLKAYGLGDAQRIGALQRSVWRWADGTAHTVKADAAWAGMSRDGRVIFAHTRAGELRQLGPDGERALSVPGAQGTLVLRAVSMDGRRLWVRDDGGTSTALYEGVVQPASEAAARAQPAAFSADGRVVAGIYVNDPAGVRPVLRWDGARVDARSCRFGGTRYGWVFLSAAGDTLAVSQPDGFCLFGGF